jgi:LacI family transcriptional regulator
MAGGAIGALRERKIRIPEHLSLISFDDARWVRYLDPPLTVIAEPAEAMGRSAAELLIARLGLRAKSRKATIEVFAPELIIRNSTADARSKKAVV